MIPPPLRSWLVHAAPPLAALGAVLWGLAAPAAAWGQPAPCSEAYMARVQRAYQAVESFRGRFAQVDRKAEGRTVRAEGDIAYRRPGRMRWAYEPPQEQLVVTDGETVWLYDPLLDNVTVQPLEDVTQGTPLAFFLGVGRLQEEFTCRRPTRPPPEDDLRYLELVPREPIPTVAFVQIGVHPESAALRALIIVDTQGNVRTVRLSGLEQGVSFPEGHFTFEVTEEMEVITE